MDDQRTNREGGGSVGRAQFGVRSLLVVTAWTSLWLGAWAVVRHVRHQYAPGQVNPVLYVATFIVIFTCPSAVFGYMVGRWRLGIVVGIAFSILFLVMAMMTMG